LITTELDQVDKTF